MGITGQTTGDTFWIKLKISSKNREKNCRLFLDIFSSAITNDLIMVFTSRFKMDAKCAKSAVKLDQSGELFGDTPS